MVNEFDKEIDAILRKARGGETVVLFDSHLDADEISAFAENALPEKSRQRYTTHLAECARCRKILSNLILLDSEAETVSASSAVSERIAETSVPWYRKLFALPQLVYVMGALVVLFSGFLGFLVLQSLTSQKSEVSYTANRSAPQAQPTIFSSAEQNDQRASESSANSSANTANSAPISTNTTTTTTNTATTTTNSAARNSNAATAQKPVITAEPQDEVVEREADKDLAKTKNDAPFGGVVKENQTKEEKKQSQTEDALRSRDDNKAMPQQAPQATPVPPSNVPKTMRKSKSAAGETRSVGGKTFQNIGGTWYDSAYTSQPRINISRGSDSYRKLDSGLRSIAESLGGTVVVVWKSKAYRIQ